jgi:hypothetical protein
MSFFHKEESFYLIRQMGRQMEAGKKLSKHSQVSISVNNSPRMLMPGERSVKLEANLSKGTAVSER